MNELTLKIYDLLDRGYLPEEAAEILDIPVGRVNQIIDETEQMNDDLYETPRWHNI